MKSKQLLSSQVNFKCKDPGNTDSLPFFIWWERKLGVKDSFSFTLARISDITATGG